MRITIAVGLVVALVGSWLGNHIDLEEMVNIGTLAAFILVSIAVPILRRKRPDLPRAVHRAALARAARSRRRSPAST